MLNTTLGRVVCPHCEGRLNLNAQKTLPGPTPEVFEVSTGQLICSSCKKSYPILAGVAVLAKDVRRYLLEHVKGLAPVVKDAEVPATLRKEYLRAKAELGHEHIEEDLEAERVIALYLMNHFLTIKATPEATAWWKPEAGAPEGSPLIESLIEKYWDQGPLAQIAQWLEKHPQRTVVEMGCGVGGLGRMSEGAVEFYLGVDSSFASIALGRHLNLGVPYSREIRIPSDLLQGTTSRKVKISVPQGFDGRRDLIVGDMEAMPVKKGEVDAAIALNTIDMLEEPSLLPRLQRKLVRPSGVVIQSCPYIWFEGTARSLRKKIPKEIRDSARAVEWLYEREGLQIQERQDQVPWLFFKHLRQLEIYSVHLFFASVGLKAKSHSR